MRIPNLIDLGRAPNKIRFVWVYRGPKGIHTGTTWQGLQRASVTDRVTTLFLVDLHTESLVTIHDFDTFMERWRVNYYNFSWDGKDIS